MVKKRRSKTDSYDDPSGNIRIAENNRMYDAFTREDVALHREINQYTVNMERCMNSRPPEVKREVLEKFVRMPRKIITRSMLTFINSSSNTGSTSKSLNIRPTTPSYLPLNPSTPPCKVDPEPIDPRSSGEASEGKCNIPMHGSTSTSSMDLRQPSSCCVISPKEDPEPASIDPRSFGEASMVKRVVANVSKPDTWNMASITQVLSGFEVASSISTRARNQAFGRSTFTMTGNSIFSRRPLRTKLTELPQMVSGKPPPFCPTSGSPPTFRPPTSKPPPTFHLPTAETVPSFQQNVQSSPPKTINPHNNYIDTKTWSSNGLPPDQGSSESTYAGMLWTLINRSWTYLSDSFMKIIG